MAYKASHCVPVGLSSPDLGWVWRTGLPALGRMEGECCDQGWLRRRSDGVTVPSLAASGARRLHALVILSHIH
jgi:hypothetical protein